MNAQNRHQIGTGNPNSKQRTRLAIPTKTAWRLAACLLASINGMPALAGTPNLLLKRTNNVYLVAAPALADDGRFYAAGRMSGADNGVVAFDSTNLDVVWGPIKPCFTFGDGGVSVGSNGKVYATGDWNSCGDGRLVALNSTDGTILWQYVNASPHPRHTPALDDSRARVCFGSSEITAIDYNTHALQWVSTAGYYIGYPMGLDEAGNLFIGTQSGSGGNTRVLSFAPSGALRWARTLYGSPELASVVAVPNPATLLLDDGQNNRLLAWNSADGTDAWQAANLTWAVTDTATNLYASAVTNTDVVSLTTSGQERWRRTLTGVTNVAVDFIDSTGLLYVHGDRTLFALRIADGSTAWQFTADNPLAVPAALNWRGRIFLSDSAGTGYLLDTALDYAPSTWPVAHFGNRRHTQKSGDVLPLPPRLSILVQPQDQSGYLGHSATFTVSATGTGPLSYQWYFNTNTLIVNATNASLTLTNLQGTNAGKYSVVVSDRNGSIPSAMAQLILYDPHTELQVEWYFDSYMYAGLNIAGRPGATYVLKYTTDLRNTNWATWTPLATNTMGSSGWFFYLDEESPYSPMRFYGTKLKP